LTQIDQVLIRCEIVGEGMFPSEVAVTVIGQDGARVSLFVDKRLLKHEGTADYVRATRLAVENDGTSVCVLPTEETDSGSRFIRIRETDLQVQAA
jgi:hypothetical protein